MKYILCPYCKKRLEATWIRSVLDKNGHVDTPCPGCHRQLAFTLRPPKASKQTEGKSADRLNKREEGQPLAYLQVVENVFGYSAQFPLYEGLNRIGRYNDRHTEIEVAIRTADPSLDRNQSLLTIEKDKQGNVVAILMDDDSMTGTFVNARELDPGEKHQLSDGDVITLGATSLIFSIK